MEKTKIEIGDEIITKEGHKIVIKDIWFSVLFETQTWVKYDYSLITGETGTEEITAKNFSKNFN